MATFKPLSRAQLAKICPDEESIRFFEKLFRQAGIDTPDETDAATIQAGNAFSAANSIAAELERVEKNSALTPTHEHSKEDSILDSGRISSIEARIDSLESKINLLMQGTLL